MYDPSCIKIFRAVDKATGVVDTTATYAMIDAALLAETLDGRSAALQTTINGYKYVPTEDDFNLRCFPKWSGGDPAAVYFKVPGTTTQQNTRLQTALQKRFRT